MMFTQIVYKSCNKYSPKKPYPKKSAVKPVCISPSQMRLPINASTAKIAVIILIASIANVKNSTLNVMYAATPKAKNTIKQNNVLFRTIFFIPLIDY